MNGKHTSSMSKTDMILDAALLAHDDSGAPPGAVVLSHLLQCLLPEAVHLALPMVLGVEESDRPVVLDLATAPHLLVAGTTGAGKSVLVHALLTNLLMHHTPLTLRLILIDTRSLELGLYEGLPHLRHRVARDCGEAAAVLEWVGYEIRDRVERLSAAGVRSVSEMPSISTEGEELARSETSPTRRAQGMPRLVIVVDDVAEVVEHMPGAGPFLAHIAQHGRAAGVHLISVTQRPGVAALSGLLALLPARVAFRLPVTRDSRAVLGRTAAQALPLPGGIIVVGSGASPLVSCRAPWTSADCVRRTVAWHARHAAADQPRIEANVLELVRAKRMRPEHVAPDDPAAIPLLREAAEVCLQSQEGSTSLLQRRLKIGYGRAALLIDALSDLGVLGKPDGSRPRVVLISAERLDELLQGSPKPHIVDHFLDRGLSRETL